MKLYISIFIREFFMLQIQFRYRRCTDRRKMPVTAARESSSGDTWVPGCAYNAVLHIPLFMRHRGTKSALLSDCYYQYDDFSLLDKTAHTTAYRWTAVADEAIEAPAKAIHAIERPQCWNRDIGNRSDCSCCLRKNE